MAEAQLPFQIAPPPPLIRKIGWKEWKMFKQMNENYEVITKLKQQDSEYHSSVFLHTVASPEGLKIFNAITFERDDKKVDVIIQKMNSVIRETNEIYERFVFNKRDQKQGELKHQSLCDRVETTC